jgi:hypothetical protein
MKAKCLVLIAAALLVPTQASAYRRGGGGGYGGGAGSTPFGSAMAGMAMFTRAAGQYNLTTSQAAVNYQQAYQQYIQNRKLAVQTAADLRRMNASYRAEQEMLHPHATPEEIAAFNQARLAQPLSGNVFDPGHGVIAWPPSLQRSEFDDNRHQIEGLFAEWAADPHASGLGTENCRDIQHAVSDLNDKLHAQIKQFQPDEYIAASKFLRSLASQARSPSGNTVASK